MSSDRCEPIKRSRLYINIFVTILPLQQSFTIELTLLRITMEDDGDLSTYKQADNV